MGDAQKNLFDIISAHHAVARRVRQLCALGRDALGHAAPRPVVAHLGGDRGDEGGGGEVDGGDNDEYRHAVPSPVVANSWLIALIILISFSFSFFAKDCLLTLVKSRLALGSPGWLVVCDHAKNG